MTYPIIANCMSCRSEITEMDLEAKRCLVEMENEINPFSLPINLSDLTHESEYLCGKCAKKYKKCPCCSGELIPIELMIAVEKVFDIVRSKCAEKEHLSGRCFGFKATATSIIACLINETSQQSTEHFLFGM